MVEVSDVRAYLSDLPSEMISDKTVAAQLEIAETIVLREKSEKASAVDVEKAIKALAGYLVYLAYATYVERGMGEVPPPMLTHLSELKAVADKLLELIRRGKPTIEPPIKLTESLLKKKEDNCL